MMACKELVKRLQPIKNSLKNPTWLDIVRMAYTKEVDLCSSFM